MFINKYSTNANKYQYIKVLSAKKGLKYFELLMIVYIFVIILLFKTNFMNLEELLLKEFREKSEADEKVLSDRTITDTIKLYGLPEEDKVDEFVEKLTPLFKTVAGQSRFILSQAKEEKEKELERIKLEYNKPQADKGVPQEKHEEEAPKNMTKEKDEHLETVLNELNAVKEELQQFKEQGTIASRKNALSNYAKELRLSDEYVLNQAMKQVDLENEDVEALKKELEVIYAREYKACRNAEAPTFGSGGGKDAASSFLEEMFAKKKAEEENIYKPKFD